MSKEEQSRRGEDVIAGRNAVTDVYKRQYLDRLGNEMSHTYGWMPTKSRYVYSNKTRPTRGNRAIG